MLLSPRPALLMLPVWKVMLKYGVYPTKRGNCKIDSLPILEIHSMRLYNVNMKEYDTRIQPQ